MSAQALEPANLGPASDQATLWRPLAVAIRPFERLRRAAWRLSAKTAFGRACLRDRPLRLTTLALGHMAVAATLTLLAPVWLLLLGPIVLGVPHVASDVRYLLVHPPLPLGRRGLALLLAPVAVMTALRVVAALGGPYSAALEVAVGAAAILGGVALARAPKAKRVLAAAVVLALGVLALAAPSRTLVVVAHLHNAVAFGLWLWLFRGEASWRAISLCVAGYVAVLALFMSGACDAVLAAHAVGSDVGRFGLVEMADTLAPGVDFELALRLVATFAFAQSIHYAVWLRLLPQRLDRRTAPPTVQRSLSRVRADFGRVGFAAVVIASLAIPLAAVAFDAADVRSLYLLAAIGHGWLELGILAALFLRGRAATWTTAS